MNRRKRPLVAVLGISMVFAALLIALQANNIFSPTHISAEDIEPINSHDLYFSNESRIFLVSAIPNYGPYPYEDASGLPSYPDVHTGDPCFIINVTIRNDYTPENPLPAYDLSYAEEGEAIISLTAELYDSNNKTIEATNVTPQYPPSSLIDAPLMLLESSETYSFNIYLLTSSRNVNSFSVKMLYLGTVSPP